MLLAWVQDTNFVLSESKGRRFSGVKRGLVEVFGGAHHFMVRFWRRARRTQEEMLASWSSFEIIISDSGGKWRVWARLAKRRVVEGPITERGWALLVGENGTRTVVLPYGNKRLCKRGRERLFKHFLTSSPISLKESS